MLKNYLKIALRNLLKNKSNSFINIFGLAVGMAVAMLIGLWIHDELNYNRNHEKYNNLAIVMQNQIVDGKTETWESQSLQLGPELRNSYGSNFARVVISSFTETPILSYNKKALSFEGNYMEAEAPEMLSLKMLKGSSAGLKDPYSILLSESLANAFFADTNPIGKTIKIDNSLDLKVTGVYQDLPPNSDFSNLYFIAPLDILIKQGNRNLGWINNWLQVFVEVAENVEMQKASEAIKDAKLLNVDKDIARFKPQLFLHPMKKWHLYSNFENGVSIGGRIHTVWLFGLIGGFVMLLACINFINLSTARSEKRAKEVGVRKVIGSARSKLIAQFLIESLMVVFLAFLFSLLLVQLSLPWFNDVAGKKASILWSNPLLWLLCFGIVFITAVISGIYPAFYLSAFPPIKVLKGTFHAGRFSSIPRKTMVIVQFTVSVTLIIGTIIVYQQVQFAKNRPLGYEMNNLITIPIKTEEVRQHFEAFRNDLLATGIISEVSTSESTVTDIWWSDNGYQWKGKDPNLQDIIYRGAVNHEFGKTVGWKIKEGRDFSRAFASDSTAVILNEAAVKYMGFKNPIGEIIKGDGKNYTVIGVVEDMVSQSIYAPAKQTMFLIDPFNRAANINVRIKPEISSGKALEKLEVIFTKHNPATPFEYLFTDEQFANKFAYEERIGKLAGFFAILAIFISCLGLFGLASFVAEQRTKEMGIRKVLGASVADLWGMLSKDFMLLVIISCIIAIPIAWYYLHGWLQQYQYRIKISCWVFAAGGSGALLITLLTVSFQAIKAAVANPVKSLRSE